MLMTNMSYVRERELRKKDSSEHRPAHRKEETAEKGLTSFSF